MKHLGNVNLEDTKAPDITFFNVIGYWTVSYPASWNLGLTILCSVLFLGFVVLGIRRKQITINAFLAGFFIFVATLVLLFFIALLLIKGILAVYPLYNRFYGSNSYNSHTYFFALTAIGIAIFSALYQWLNQKFNTRSLLAGILLLEVILLNLLYSVMPTGIFIILFPLLFLIIGNIIVIYRGEQERGNLISSAVILISLLPAILLIPSTVEQMYIVFGLTTVTAAVVVVLGLLLGLLIPILSTTFEVNRYLITGLAVIIFFASLLVGHVTSNFDASHPLQSSLYYQLRADENKAYWISDFPDTDEWNKQYFQGAKVEDGKLLNVAPLLPLSAPSAVILKDTIVNEIRKLHLHLAFRQNALSMTIRIGKENLAGDVTVRGSAGGIPQSNKSASLFSYVNYVGLDSLGVEVIFETTPGKPFEFSVVDRSLGLPVMVGMADRPAWIIPGVGSNSNTMQVTKKFVF